MILQRGNFPSIYNNKESFMHGLKHVFLTFESLTVKACNQLLHTRIRFSVAVNNINFNFVAYVCIFT